MKSSSNAPISRDQEKSHTKNLIDEFGDTINVDDITYLECVIAYKRGVTFRWIKDIAKLSHKVYLKDQHFDQ